jgi:hypothetical protein
MSNVRRYFIGLAALTLTVAGCASSSAQQPAPVQPAAAPPAKVVAEVETQHEAIEPGRFDMGKMWTFENAPLDYFEEAYDFRPSQEWLDHVRIASLRLPNCTASFVSPDGLVATNHHCARESTSSVTEEGESLLDDGFLAATMADERRVPDLYVDQMILMEDVTAMVQGAVTAMASRDRQAQERAARQEAIADSASSLHGLACDVTELYHGGMYSLYCHKRYEDVRLVFTPELRIGAFGGDPDNFTYPRYSLDVTFFRVYDEDGNPYRPAKYFGWSETGAAEGEAVFVIGNPGSTSRLSTMAQLEFFRDYNEPTLVHLLQTRTDVLQHYMDHHPETRDENINLWSSWMNGLKLYIGRERALNDPAVMGRKLGWELALKDAVAADPDLRAKYAHLWDEIAELRAQMAEVFPTVQALHPYSPLRTPATLRTAARMLDYSVSVGRASQDQLDEMRAGIEETEIDVRLDRHMLEERVKDVIKWLGEDDPFVRAVLQGDTSLHDATAGFMERATAVLDPELRNSLLDSPTRILNSSDPALSVVREILPRYGRASQRYRQLLAEEEALTAQLALAVFDVYGTDLPPDATFTLRITDGVVQGYEYNGTIAPPWTTFYGMYDRHYSHKDQEVWDLPERWRAPPPEFDMRAPVNMVSTHDTIGGNSGSPMINTALEIVGLVFDGNIEGLSGDYIYDATSNRTISVRAEGIMEALEHIYGADRIVDELRRH